VLRTVSYHDRRTGTQLITKVEQHWAKIEYFFLKTILRVYLSGIFLCGDLTACLPVLTIDMLLNACIQLSLPESIVLLFLT
jgi:hypothetical protein